MKVDIPKLAQPLIEKYKDKTGKRLFNFYQYYVDEKGFNAAWTVYLSIPTLLSALVAHEWRAA